MIENIDNVLLKDILGEFMENANFVITDYVHDIPTDGIRIHLPVEGEDFLLNLIIDTENALMLGEINTGVKPESVDESITMTLSVILKKIGDVLSYFSEYTFGEPVVVNDKIQGERKYYQLEISRQNKTAYMFVSEPAEAEAGAVEEEEEPQLQAIKFEPSQDDNEKGNNWGLVMDIPIDIMVELGTTKMTIQEVLNLVPGSVIELNKLSGESVDVLANGRLFAEGEVVVVGDNFGVRLTNIKEIAIEAHQRKVA